MDDQLDGGRKALLKEIAAYLHTYQMPLTLTGDTLTPQLELARLQEIHRLLEEHRNGIVALAQLYSCRDCGSAEGEMHCGDCSLRMLGRVLRPPNWSPSMTQPVEIVDIAPVPCPVPGCIYFQVPGVGFCAQHREAH